MLNQKLKNVAIDGELLFSKSGAVKVTNPNGSKTPNTPAFETLSAARTLKAAESGRTLFLDLAGGFAVTLPPPAFGLKYSFIVKTAPTTAYTVVTQGSSNIIVGLHMSAAAAGGDTGATDDTISFVANQAVAGDKVEVVSDGAKWYAYAASKVLAGITFTTAS